MITWFARNHVAANLLMIGIILAGIYAVKEQIALALLPDFNLGTISVTTVLPGGNPKSLEETVTSRIEEAVADLEGIKKISSRSSEDISNVFIEIDTDYDEQEVLSDVKIRVDAINTLPNDAERPIIELAKQQVQVIGLAVYGNVSSDDLFQATTDMREALLRVEGISSASDIQAPPREIHVEVTPETLKQYNLTLTDVGRAIQRNSIDISAGNLRTLNGDILIRSDGQMYTKSEFESIPVISDNNRIVYLKDIANVIDGYVLRKVETQYNGLPAITIDVFRVGKQSTIEVAEKTLNFIESYQTKLQSNLKIGTYGNTASVVEDRLSTLISSAIQGGIVVLILLSLFLRPAVALWVGIGIPICFLGGLALMPALGLTLNMLSMFAFLLVLGIVVDDAIVTGENIYRHMRNGMPPAEAALFGTKEVAVPVTFGVITTMVAFAPLLLIEGFLSAIAAQIPLVVIPVLAFSLIESKLILPSHMSTIKPRDDNQISKLGQLQQSISRGFENAIIKFYKPLLNLCVSNKTITLTCAILIFVIAMTSAMTGWLRVSFFPQFQDNAVYITLSMPTTTGYDTTKSHIERIVDISTDLADEYIDPQTNESYFKYVISVSGLTISGTGGLSFGNNLGMVIMEFVQGENGIPEGFSIATVQEQLRNRIGDIPGAEKLSLRSSFGDFGRPISVQLYGDDSQRISQLTKDIREYLKSYPGVFDIQDNVSSGKEELKIDITPVAKSIGLSQSDVAIQVRQAVFGYEAQRIQRGHEEIKVMVRYPEAYRSSINDINNIPIKASNIEQGTIPLNEVATLVPTKSSTSIYRDQQRRAVTVSANIDAEQYDVDVIRSDLSAFLNELFLYETETTFEFGGQSESQNEAAISFLFGFLVVIMVIYALLAIPFKSFGQPFVVMSIIPLAIVGAMLGHYIMRLPFSMLSIMGVLGLTGIVVNDSLVLVDYINKKRSEGMELMQAVLTAGELRFRPVMLTSLTTFAGLLPLMLNKNTQAQSLIPMAVSLGFGIMFATMITLIITPVNYLAGRQLKHWVLDWWNKPTQLPLNKNAS